MTNEEIKKMLDCTARITGNELVKNAFNLITEQENEIKQLQTNADILARGVRDLYHENYELSEQLKETIQRFANYLKVRLFAVFGTSADNVGSTQDIADVINNSLKEYEDAEDKS